MFGLTPYVHRNMINAPYGFRVDVRDAGDHYALDAELPGVRKEDISVTVENGMLTISAVTTSEEERHNGNYVYRERRQGSLRRAFSLEGIREEDITGRYENGVLSLTLPRKTEAVSTRREISIA